MKTRTAPTQQDFNFWSQNKHVVDIYGLRVAFGDSRTDRIRYRRVNSQIVTWGAGMPAGSLKKLNLQVTRLGAQAPDNSQLYFTLFNPPAWGSVNHTFLGGLPPC